MRLTSIYDLQHSSQQRWILNPLQRGQGSNPHPHGYWLNSLLLSHDGNPPHYISIGWRCSGSHAAPRVILWDSCYTSFLHSNSPVALQSLRGKYKILLWLGRPQMVVDDPSYLSDPLGHHSPVPLHSGHPGLPATHWPCQPCFYPRAFACAIPAAGDLCVTPSFLQVFAPSLPSYFLSAWVHTHTHTHTSPGSPVPSLPRSRFSSQCLPQAASLLFIGLY